MKNYLLRLIVVALSVGFYWHLISLPVMAQQPTSSPVQQSTFARIQERGHLIAGVKYDAPPFGFLNQDDQLAGFEIDLMHEFARRWLGDSNAVEFIQVTSSDRTAKLLSGDIDIIAATMTCTAQRDELIDFSQTYYVDGQNILVRSEMVQPTDEESIRQLAGKHIATVRGSTSAQRIVEFALEQGIAVDVVTFEQYTDAIRPLFDGAVDAISTDRGILTGLAAERTELTILLKENFSYEPYGFGLAPGDKDFAHRVNLTLQEIKAENIYDQIFTKWFGNTVEPYNILIDPSGEVSCQFSDKIIPAIAKATTTLPPVETPTPIPPKSTIPITLVVNTTATVAAPTLTPSISLTLAFTPASVILTTPVITDATPSKLPETGASTFSSYSYMPAFVGASLGILGLVLSTLFQKLFQRSK